jgi:2-oxo-3-hexenedioate decarboxylase
MLDPDLLADELAAAYAHRRLVPVLPSSREGGLDLTTAYAAEARLMRLRQAAGHRTVGRKIGFGNRALWRVLKLETVAWAHMYDDTVRYATDDVASVTVGRMVAPKIEPEIVFRMKAPLDGAIDAGPVLHCVESVALGFEIIDCVYPDWKFTPVDFVAAYGLHAGLIVGEPKAVQADDITPLIDQLASFTVTLQKNGQTVAQGSGKNSLKSPALCLGELGAAIVRQGAPPLAPGEYVSSGTLTEAQVIAAGDTYTAVVEGIGLPALTVRITV